MPWRYKSIFLKKKKGSKASVEWMSYRIEPHCEREITLTVWQEVRCTYVTENLLLSWNEVFIPVSRERSFRAAPRRPDSRQHNSEGTPTFVFFRVWSQNSCSVTTNTVVRPKVNVLSSHWKDGTCAQEYQSNSKTTLTDTWLINLCCKAAGRMWAVIKVCFSFGLSCMSDLVVLNWVEKLGTK